MSSHEAPTATLEPSVDAPGADTLPDVGAPATAESIPPIGSLPDTGEITPVEAGSEAAEPGHQPESFETSGVDQKVISVVEQAAAFRALYKSNEDEGVSRKDYKQIIHDAVTLVDDEAGLDSLAYLTVAAQRERDKTSEKLANAGEGNLSDDDLQDMWEMQRSLATINDIVKSLPKDSRKSYRARLAEHEEEVSPAETLVDDTEIAEASESDHSVDAVHHAGDEDLTPDVGEDIGYVNLGDHESRFSRLAHAAREKVAGPRLAKALGIVATVGVAYGISRGHIPGPEHMHAMKGFTEYAYGQDKVSEGEWAATDAAIVGLIIGGVRHSYKNVKARREHIEHSEHEHHVEHAEHESLETMVANNPGSAALIEDMKNPDLLKELDAKGEVGSIYSSDVVRQYARLIAPKVGGSAEAVKKHFEYLGIDIGDTEIIEASTPSGKIILNVSNPDKQKTTAIAEALVRGDLHYGDLPPTDAFLGDHEIHEALEELSPHDPTIDGLRRKMRWALETPYNFSDEPTVHDYIDQVNALTEGILDRLADKLPSNEAREAALHALQMQDLVETYMPEDDDSDVKLRYRTKKFGTGAIPVTTKLEHFAHAH
jgi:hypothetical protein